MLYRIGRLEEIPDIAAIFPKDVRQHLYKCIARLEEAYGKDRDYLCCGGYSLLAQNREDVALIGKTIDLEQEPFEWAERIGDYLCALYLPSDDYAIVVFLPAEAAPKTLLKELNA